MRGEGACNIAFYVARCGLIPFSNLQGANRPSARAITLALLHQPYFKAVSATNGSMLAAAVGQLICEWCHKSLSM